MKNISVIILHFGKYQDTVECLDSLNNADKKNVNLKIFLADNGTKENFPQYKNISIIRNEKNLGFAAGINRGLKEAFKDRAVASFLILNNDTSVPKNFFEEIIKSENDITGAVIKFLNNKGEVIFDYGGRLNPWTGRTSHLEEKKHFKKPAKEADYVSGCCMLVRRKVFESIGLFDERFFFYFEDVDFCLRAKKYGFKIGVQPQTVINHKLSSSIGRWSNRAIYYNIKANFQLVNKHFGIRKLSAWVYLCLLAGKIIWDKIKTS